MREILVLRDCVKLKSELRVSERSQRTLISSTDSDSSDYQPVIFLLHINLMLPSLIK